MTARRMQVYESEYFFKRPKSLISNVILLETAKRGVNQVGDRLINQLAIEQSLIS